MAGLGETCSHVGAVLFYAEAVHKIKDSATVTGEKAYWLFPSNVLNNEMYNEISAINLFSKILKKRWLIN